MCFFANCCESPERAFRKNPQFLTKFALVKYREYRVIIVLKPQISCNIVWTLKKISLRGGQGRLEVFQKNIHFCSDGHP